MTSNTPQALDDAVARAAGTGSRCQTACKSTVALPQYGPAEVTEACKRHAGPAAAVAALARGVAAVVPA